jgi:cytochrome c oxidase subunit 2
MKRGLVLALLLAAIGSGSIDGRSQNAVTPRVIHIVAERFTFTPSRITVEEGTTVELRITSEDTAHGFKLTGPTAVDVEIPKRGRGDRRVVFTPTEAGTYTFECSRVCGAGHGFMRGTVQVKAREPQEHADGPR